MKKILLMLALAGGVASAHAQSADTTAVNDLTLKADIYPQQEDGDLYHGLSRKLTFDRMIPPYGLEVTYDKTTHIIFPSAVRYVDLGSPNLIAGKADGSENVIRVKATRKNFRDYRKRKFLHLQCEVCRRASAAQHRDGRFYS